MTGRRVNRVRANEVQIRRGLCVMWLGGGRMMEGFGRGGLDRIGWKGEMERGEDLGARRDGEGEDLGAGEM